MQVYVHTDHSVEGGGGLTSHVEREVRAALSHVGDRITRVEVHLSDQSAGRSTGADIRCLIEARPAGRAAVTATADADSVDQALTGAVHKLGRLLDSDDGQRADRDGRASIRGRVGR